MLLTWCCLLGMLVLGCSSIADDGGAAVEGPRQVVLRAGEETTLPTRIKIIPLRDNAPLPEGDTYLLGGSVGVSRCSPRRAEDERRKLTCGRAAAVSFRAHLKRVGRPPMLEGTKSRSKTSHHARRVPEKSGSRKTGDVPDPPHSKFKGGRVFRHSAFVSA